jgi:PhnB protein
MELTPFLLFDGNCDEAMRFYHACLGGELSVTKASETPMARNLPPEKHGRVVFAQLRSGPLTISATDWLHPTRRFSPGNNVAIYLSEGTYQELREPFDRLADGADPDLLDDLREMPFGSYGHLADRFGIHWFFKGEKL